MRRSQAAVCRRFCMRVRGSFSRHPTVARCTMTWLLRLSGGVVVPTATQANLALPRSCSEDRRAGDAGEAGEVSRRQGWSVSRDYGAGDHDANHAL
ncbi:hypothetical protein HPB50_007412 [Hyalomma asiaticum]|uniref:Uncharacterized protein n=1 Tax=Hyalomma asiaticum TaxID=266040 RepID=A0ACB7TE90_HYAAI|nr:hypothetical protein HPB50_007412 [Hyalomma asiaticum]